MLDHSLKKITAILSLVILTACGGGGSSSDNNNNNGSGSVDTSPDTFTLLAQTDTARDTVVDSNTVTVSGINAASAISILGGEYSLDGGAYTSSAATISNGQTVSVRQTSSADFSTTTTATLTIGGVNGVFSVTTLAIDETPETFSFVDLAGVSIDTVVASNTITISGINTSVPISVTGGEYSIDGAPYTNSAGVVNDGQRVSVQQTSSGSFATTTEATLTVGTFSDSFAATTITEPLVMESFIKTTDATLRWVTQGALSCVISNDQNDDTITLDLQDLDSGSAVHKLPSQTRFTLTCLGEAALPDDLSVANVDNNLFPETVGYYGSSSSLDNSWAAIVNLNNPISFTDRVDFNNQADAYCTGLGYIGVVKTTRGDFSTHDTYYLQNQDGIIAGNGPRNKVTIIPGDVTFTNVYTNRRNTNQVSNGNVGIATIGNNASTIQQSVPSPTTGVDQMLLCQTDIRFRNTFPLAQVISFVDTGPVDIVLGVDTPLTNIASGGVGSGATRYLSNNTNVATVNETTGEVTAIGLGSATITAIKQADTHFFSAQASYVVNVVSP